MCRGLRIAFFKVAIHRPNSGRVWLVGQKIGQLMGTGEFTFPVLMLKFPRTVVVEIFGQICLISGVFSHQHAKHERKFVL